MTDEIKQEVIEQVDLDVKFGFENRQQLFTSIREMFYSENDFDEGWLKMKINEKFSSHEKDSSNWLRPTDFDRLAAAFDQLIAEKIVCLHNAGYTKSDGEGDCFETMDRLDELGIETIGFCYYHSQDLARAVDPNIKNLYIGFDSRTQDDTKALFVANKIVDKLKFCGFQIFWPGTVDQRIELKNIDWKKLPDDQNWGAERAIQILLKSKESVKPFWKFW